MARKKRDFKRVVLGDPKFGEAVVTRTVNMIMKSGKKGVAERALYAAFDILEKKQNEKALDIFGQALGNIKPMVEVRSRRVGGATYQVPTEVNPRRAETLGIRWLVEAANSRGERTLAEKLAAEILDALQNRGTAVKTREDTHRMADANKAFAHFRW